MKKFAKLLLVLCLATSISACKKDKNVLAQEYFNSNVAAYSIYGQIGVDLMLNTVNNIYNSTDPKAQEMLKRETGTCTKEEFIAHIRTTREFTNKVISRVITEEIAKEFSEEELEKMAKFYSSYYDAQMRADMKDLSLSNNDPKKAEALINKITPEKKQAFKEYNESELGKKEQNFLASLNTRMEARKAELEKEKLPEPPACLNTKVAPAAAPAKAAAPKAAPTQVEPAEAAPAAEAETTTQPENTN